MKLLIITTNFPPNNDGGVARILALKSFFNKKNVKVDILTRGWGESTNEEKTIHRVLDPTHENSNKIFRIMNSLFIRFCSFFGIHVSYYFIWQKLASRKLKLLIEQNYYDYIIGSYPSIEVLKILNEITNYEGDIIIDYRDPLVFETAELYLKNKFPKIFNSLPDFEQNLIHKSKYVLTVAPTITEYINKTHKISKAHTITNGFDSPAITLSKFDKVLFENLIASLDKSKINIVYTGTLSFYDKERKANYLFDALSELNSIYSSNIRIYLFGKFDKNEFDNYKDLIDNKTIIVNGLISRNLSRVIQRNFDLLLLVTDKGRSCVTTGKIFEYLQSNTPILGLTSGTHAEHIIRETNTGLCVDPENKIEIKNIFMSIIKNRGMLYNPNNEIIKKYSRDYQMNKLWEILH